MTRFGRDFPFLTADNVGNLLVLIPKNYEEFIAYVLHLEDDIEHIQAALGTEVVESWGVFTADRMEPPVETPNECIERNFNAFVARVDDFPTGDAFSAETIRVLRGCIMEFSKYTADDRLLQCMDAEYQLFKLVEKKVCGPIISRMFKDFDNFLQTAQSVMNRRKSRAGRSLENHVAMLLRDIGIPFDVRPPITGEPDIVIPSRDAYEDPNYPESKLFVIGVKNTCKDRWRQVVEEAPRVRSKFILTLQKGVSTQQLKQMYQQYQGH
jgi:type II restriction enzyme